QAANPTEKWRLNNNGNTNRPPQTRQKQPAHRSQPAQKLIHQVDQFPRQSGSLLGDHIQEL
ncbi:hypothetical protein, partial [Corynebacterium phocae]|uniref:hypothetical protein n=1 Tax=Corynebacterium phocae TaxID=161895 RepID=UPI001B86EB8B